MFAPLLPPCAVIPEIFYFSYTNAIAQIARNKTMLIYIGCICYWRWPLCGQVPQSNVDGIFNFWDCVAGTWEGLFEIWSLPGSNLFKAVFLRIPVEIFTLGWKILECQVSGAGDKHQLCVLPFEPTLKCLNGDGGRGTLQHPNFQTELWKIIPGLL